MSKISDILKNFFSHNFGKLALITSITTINSSNKISVKLTLLLMILIILKVVTPEKISLIKRKLLNINGSEKNENEDIIDELISNVDDLDNIDILLDIDDTSSENNKDHNFKKILRNKNQDDEKCNIIKDKIKNNIKLTCKKINTNDKYSKDPYTNSKTIIEKNYKNENDISEFILNVNSNTCSTPIFNLRKYSDIDYYHNFIIHDFDPKKLNNLIMCKDIHKWMSTSSLSDEDLADDLVPIYYITKNDNNINVYEYLRIFIHSDEDETRNALVQKGTDYLNIENDINELIQKGLIKDLLCSKKYINYNLSSRDGICSFLDKLLSHVLIPEQYIGDIVHLDINNYVENKHTYDYHLNTINADLGGFNTTI